MKLLVLSVAMIMTGTLCSMNQWNVKNNEGKTLAHLIAGYCSERDEVIWSVALVQCGDMINPFIKDADGKTARMVAEEQFTLTGKNRCEEIGLILETIEYSYLLQEYPRSKPFFITKFR